MENDLKGKWCEERCARESEVCERKRGVREKERCARESEVCERKRVAREKEKGVKQASERRRW